ARLRGPSVGRWRSARDAGVVSGHTALFRASSAFYLVLDYLCNNERGLSRCWLPVRLRPSTESARQSFRIRTKLVSATVRGEPDIRDRAVSGDLFSPPRSGGDRRRAGD